MQNLNLKKIPFLWLMISAIGLAVLSGCAVGPDYIRPQPPEMKEWIEREDPRIKSEPADLAAWWKRFNDSVLNTLIERAFEQNLSLRIAGIRILEARAQLGIAVGNQYPQLQQLRGDYTGIGISENAANTIPNMDSHFTEADIGFDAAWELDFWGRFSRAVEFGVWNLDASIAGYDDILVTLLAEMGKSHPALRDVLIDERDRYLAAKIRVAPGDRVVAVVGAGHVPGIRKYFQTDIDLEALERVPPGGTLSRVLKWGIPAVIASLIVLGFYLGGTQTGKEMLSWWILSNSILAGLGALLAAAHPLTILSAVLAAPLTSLNPMIAAGWVAGLVEAFLRKPRVRDFEDLPQAITTARGFWNNKVTRILLVVVFTNLGSVLGTIVGGTYILKAMIAWVVRSWGSVSGFFQQLLG